MSYLRDLKSVWRKSNMFGKFMFIGALPALPLVLAVWLYLDGFCAAMDFIDRRAQSGA